MTRLVHTHRHSQDSLLDGTGTQKQYADRAAELGQWALAQTDHANLSGALHHIVACEAAGIVPIVGVEAYFREDRGVREDVQHLREYYHMVLLAKDFRGWQNLLRITSRAYSEGFYGKPCVDIQLLEEHGEGLMCTTACISGFLSYNTVHEGECVVSGRDLEKARKAEVPLRYYDSKRVGPHLDMLERIFGDGLWFEIMPHDFDEQRRANLIIAETATSRGHGLIATQDAHVPYEEWVRPHNTQDVALMISTGQSFQKRREQQEKGEDTYTFDADTIFLTSEEEMRAQFEQHHPDLPASTVSEAIGNTSELARRVEPFVVDDGPKMPRVTKKQLPFIQEVTSSSINMGVAALERDRLEELDGEELAEVIVRCWCQEGLERTADWYDEVRDEHGFGDGWTEDLRLRYEAQLEYELKIFGEKKVFSYFVVIGEAVRWARKQHCRVGAGRGSAAGSTALFLMGITGISPIGHGLMFERFMNPARSDMPDVDLDFQHKAMYPGGCGRAEVKAHVGDVWGHDHVADVISHGTFGIRSVIGAVSRAFDVPYDEYMDITKNLDDGSGDYGLADVHELSADFRRFCEKHPEVWIHCQRLENQRRNVSKHAAGVVVTDRPITDYMPTMRANDGSVVTAWSEQADFPIISKYGFLKIDFLGIDGLSTQDVALKLIAERHGVETWRDYGGISMCILDRLPAMLDPRWVDDEVMQLFRNGSTLGIFQFEGRGITGLLRQIKPTDMRDLTAANALYRPGPLESGTAYKYGEIKNGKAPAQYPSEAARQTLEETFGIMVYQEQSVKLSQDLCGYDASEADLVRRNLTKLSSAKVSDNAGRIALEQQSEEMIRRGVEHGTPRDVVVRYIEELKFATRYSFNKSHAAGYSGESYQDGHLKTHFGIEFYGAMMTVETEKVPQAIREAMGRGFKVLPPDVNTSGADFGLDGDAIRFGLTPVKWVGEGAIDAIVRARAAGPFSSRRDFEARVEARKCNSRVREALVAVGAFDSFGERDGMETDEKARSELELIGMALSGGGVQEYMDILRPRVHTPSEVEAADEREVVTVGGEITRLERKVTKRGHPYAWVDIMLGADTYECVAWNDVIVGAGHLLWIGNVVLAKAEKDSSFAMSIRSIVSADDLRRHLSVDTQGAAA